MDITTAAFLTRSSPVQFEYLLKLYPTALQLKAESKSKKPADLIRLDEWFQEELPKKLESRQPETYLVHDELVNVMKWKLARGKFRPRLKELVTMNSPRVVQQVSKKAYRALFKKDDISAAINYLCSLKGIGPATASALLTAAAPSRAAFMADECLQAVPEIEGIDYTLAEYLEMMRAIKQAQLKLGSPELWTPHNIELVLWTHNVLLTLKPDLLANVPDHNVVVVPPASKNGSSCHGEEEEEEEDNYQVVHHHENSIDDEDEYKVSNYYQGQEQDQVVEQHVENGGAVAASDLVEGGCHGDDDGEQVQVSGSCHGNNEDESTTEIQLTTPHHNDDEAETSITTIESVDNGVPIATSTTPSCLDQEDSSSSNSNQEKQQPPPDNQLAEESSSSCEGLMIDGYYDEQPPSKKIKIL